MDWDLPVYLPNANKIVETQKFLPEITKIENNDKHYILVKWYINRQDELDKKKFLEYVDSISERNIGFYFIANPAISATNVFDYVIQVPKKITIYGLQFGVLPTKRF